MNKDYIEREIKIKVDNPNRILSLLTDLKAKKKGEVFQRTVRMETPNLDLEKQGIFLRVRTGGKNIVTLKKKMKTNGEVFERREIETEVKDPEVLTDIFANLGFNKRLIMEKYRIEYEYQNTIVSVDELPFGVFIEIEGKIEDIINTAKELKLDISKKIIVSYWDLFEEHKKHTGEKGENIVFPDNYHPITTSTARTG